MRSYYKSSPLVDQVISAGWTIPLPPLYIAWLAHSWGRLYRYGNGLIHGTRPTPTALYYVYIVTATLYIYMASGRGASLSLYIYRSPRLSIYIAGGGGGATQRSSEHDWRSDSSFFGLIPIYHMGISSEPEDEAPMYIRDSEPEAPMYIRDS